MPGLQARSPVRGLCEATDPCVSPSLRPSLSLSLLKKRKEKTQKPLPNTQYVIWIYFSYLQGILWCTIPKSTEIFLLIMRAIIKLGISVQVHHYYLNNNTLPSFVQILLFLSIGLAKKSVWGFLFHKIRDTFFLFTN